MDITMVKYVFVSQKRAIKSDRKKYALRSRSSQTQNVYFFLLCFWGGGLPFYLLYRHCSCRKSKYLNTLEYGLSYSTGINPKRNYVDGLFYRRTKYAINRTMNRYYNERLCPMKPRLQ